MVEYIRTVSVAANGTVIVPLPSGTVHGVYSTGAVDLSWIYNSEIGQIAAGVTMWEPSCGFNPGLSSELMIENTTATAVNVTLRLSSS